MADPIIKCYEDKLNPADAVLVVTTDKYTYTFPIKDAAEAAKATEKLDVKTEIARREKILDSNTAYIAARVSGKDAPKEIDYSGLVKSFGDAGAGGKV